MVVGIDLGLSGAIATLDYQGCASVFDLPVFDTIVNKKKRHAYDVPAIIKIIENNVLAGSCIFIEKVQPLSIPGTNSAANFSLGYAKGLIEAILTIRRLKYEFVNPKEWQSHFGIIKPKEKDQAKEWDTKGQSYAIASKMFPEVVLKTVKGRILDGRCDALLIAEWGLRRVNGGRKDEDKF